MTGTNELEMKIHQVKDKLSDISYRLEKFEARLESLSNTLLEVSSKAQALRDRIDGDKK